MEVPMDVLGKAMGVYSSREPQIEELEKEIEKLIAEIERQKEQKTDTDLMRHLEATVQEKKQNHSRAHQ